MSHPNGNGDGTIPIIGGRFERQEQRLPPQNIEAEQSVLGSILLEPERLPEVMRVLFVPDFYREAHQAIYQAMIDLYEEGVTIDAVSLADMLGRQGRWEDVGGDGTIQEVIEAVPHAANVAYYARIVREKSIGRQAIDRLGSLISDAYEGKLTAPELVDRMARLSTSVDPMEEEEIELPGPWPDALRPAAYQGVVGEILRAIEPHTSADPAAILVQFLVAFSNVIGHGPHWYFEATRHALNLFCCLVGSSSRGGKGTSWDYIKRIMGALDPEWYPKRIMSGLASGEGLIEQVRDARFERVRVPGDERLGGGGHEWKEVDPGEPDKRALWEETEFDGTLAVANREGNILSAKLRQLWDSGCAQSASRSKPVRCTDAHVSIVGHVTLRALLEELSGTNRSNGFGNRFLWVCVRRRRGLPLGGQFRAETIHGAIERLSAALDFARFTDWSAPMTLSKEAIDLWCREYPRLSRDRPGGLDDLTSRAEAQVRRLACLYAVLDCTTQVQAEHLEAAIAVWDYCEQSAACVFGGGPAQDPNESKLIRALDAGGGLSATDVRRRVFQGRISKHETARILGSLVRTGRVIQSTVKTGGRDRTLWTLNTYSGKGQENV